MNLAVKQNEDLPNMVEFSDEEGYGRFLDLHEHYQRYVNIKGLYLMGVIGDVCLLRTFMVSFVK